MNICKTYLLGALFGLLAVAQVSTQSIVGAWTTGDTTVQDLNGDTGLSNISGTSGVTFTVAGDNATITVPGGGSVSGTRVTGSSRIVGAWGVA